MERSERIGIVVSCERSAAHGFARRLARGYAMRATRETGCTRRGSRRNVARACNNGPHREILRFPAPDFHLAERAAKPARDGFPLPRCHLLFWHGGCYLQRSNDAECGVAVLRPKRSFTMKAWKLESLTFALAMTLATTAGAQMSNGTHPNDARNSTSGEMRGGMPAQCANTTGRAMSDCVRDHYPSCAGMNGTALNDCMSNHDATGARRGTSAMRDKSGGGTADGNTGTTGTTGTAGASGNSGPSGASGNSGASGASGTGGASGAGK
jgi:hypothetical protein